MLGARLGIILAKSSNLSLRLFALTTIASVAATITSAVVLSDSAVLATGKAILFEL
jgi:hypothetical protein